MKKLLLLFLFLLVVPNISEASNVVINEVHPAGGEWVEIYNNGSSQVNLTGWKIGDGQKNDSLDGLQIGSYSFGLIVDSDLNCTQFNISRCIKSEGKLGGWGLNNEGENITLYNESGVFIDRINYPKIPEKFSAGRKSDGGEWNYSIEPTPGRPNQMSFLDETDSTADSDGSVNDTNSTGEEPEEVKRNRIEILDAPKSAEFGSILSVEIEVSRNGTQAHTVYARVERPDNWDVSEDTKIKLGDRSSGRNQNYTVTIPVLLRPNCDGRYEDGDYEIMVEGMGVRDSETLEISGTKDSTCKEIEKVKEVKKVKEVNKSCECPEIQPEEYEILSHDENVTQGGKVKTSLLVRNRGNSTKSLKIYSYVYENGTPLNAEGWTGNARNLTVEAGSNEVVEMVNEIEEDAEPGVHDLKIRIKGEEDLLGKVEVVERKVNNSRTTRNTSDYNQTSKESENRSTVKTTTKTDERMTGRVFRDRDPLEKLFSFLGGIFS